MAKNYLLYVIFSLLMAVTSASACLAGQDSVPAPQKNHPIICVQTHNETEKVESSESFPLKKESKDEEVKDTSPSILNSNFIFYIIYKFKFVDAAGSKSNDDNGDKVSMPIIDFSRSLYIALHSLFEKKF